MREIKFRSDWRLTNNSHPMLPSPCIHTVGPSILLLNCLYKNGTGHRATFQILSRIFVYTRQNRFFYNRLDDNRL